MAIFKEKIKHICEMPSQNWNLLNASRNVEQSLINWEFSRELRGHLLITDIQEPKGFCLFVCLSPLMPSYIFQI